MFSIFKWIVGIFLLFSIGFAGIVGISNYYGSKKAARTEVVQNENLTKIPVDEEKEETISLVGDSVSSNDADNQEVSSSGENDEEGAKNKVVEESISEDTFDTSNDEKIEHSPVKEQRNTVLLTENEIMEIIEMNYYSIFTTMRETDEKYNWTVNQEEPVYEIVEPELLNNVTKNFAINEIQPYFKDFFCECDFGVLPYLLELDIRMDIIENTEDFFMIETIQSADELNGGDRIILTAKKIQGNWLLDEITVHHYYDYNNYTIQSIELSVEEATKLVQKNAPSYQYSKTVTLPIQDQSSLNGEVTDVYIYENGNGEVIGIEEVNGYSRYDQERLR
ncbi:hypothetical protein [Guptibacillus hwajinpoensis]|uniref:Uncharacterized protein n=1 Tax=Guptibacillus hwajinpoensis TaxID=208199 RepID=A0ABU0K275_9BACL|nr:hypothetical protein [Alkalihalobacillus hemicentroti]MDQ0482513.1 hypothetical protein [Alkalihalobacillus hemicentroti]